MMMMDGDFESPFRPTPAKLFGGLWLVVWTGVAYHEYGPMIAARVGLSFAGLLTLIWIPELLSKLPLPIHQRDLGALGPVPPMFLRIIGWVILLGLPAAWFFLWRDSG